MNNKREPVPTVSGCLLGFRDPREEIHIKSGGGIRLLALVDNPFVLYFFLRSPLHRR
jgi:hypothetical protein